MTSRQKKKLIRILISAVLLIALVVLGNRLPDFWYVKAILFFIPYIIIGWDILWKAVRGLFSAQFLDENFLMSIASVGAFIIGEYPEAVAVMLFYQVGTLFEEYAVGRSRKSIAALMDIRPDFAYLERDGEIQEVDPDEVAIGDIIVIRAGEKIPLDGIIIEGETTVDTSALTGESLPRDLVAGDAVVSGTVNLSGRLRVRVTQVFGESTVSKILDLVENASAKKAKTENFISKFARFYTPIVVISALVLAIVPSLITGEWSVWVYRALSFLVTSCPCALVISVPLSFFGGIGAASKKGILVKGGNYMEALSRLETVVFDKTGTLTKGTFRVTAVYPAKDTEKETLLEYAALAESNTHHPIGKSIEEAYAKPIDESRIASVTELAGKGISAVIDGKRVLIGGEKLMRDEKIDHIPVSDIGTAVYVALDGKFLGSLVISDEEKADAKEAISSLRALGVRKTVMLTGDNEAVGKAVATALGLDEVYAGLLPADKVEKVEQLLAEKSEKAVLAFVGDGINDAPVLSRADLGIAMGAMGSDAAVEASDIVLMDDKPSKIASAVHIAKRTMRIVYSNIIFAIAVKILVLLLVAVGLVGMWAAVFADVGVSVLAILNAMRVLKDA
ncbi:MAG: cadmium-translocating P-type ATPase [Clostridia bacterium]|nr:cadmium-translocating P-type ATPase [Clostridia bacterium]